MARQQDELAVVAAFLQQYSDDHARDDVRSLSEYQARYPGYEALIAAEYEALGSGIERCEAAPETDPIGGVEFSADLAGRYVSPEEVARGGMGIVYRVWDQDLRRSVAMKVLPEPGPAAALRRDPRAVDRFLREARITGQLEHPGIVPVHALGRDAEGRFFFTMTMVQGHDFGVVIRRARGGKDGTWTLHRAVEVLLRVCDAMAFAHGKGVIHRDLKPGNVMVGKFGETYVMDWGLARQSEADMALGPDDETGQPGAGHTLAGEILGTPAYMPPEQARGDLAGVDHRSDVYAIGAMLYELLTGEPPYHVAGGDNSSRAVLQRVVAGPAPMIDPAGAPAELAAICQQATARDPGCRYQTVSELAGDLRAFLEQRVVRAYEIGAFAELRKWVRRNRAVAAAAALALLGALGFGVREHYVGAELVIARDAAEGQLATKQEILRFLDEDLLAAVAPEAQGRNVTMRQVLDVAAARIESRFPSRPEVEAELRRTIGSTYRKLGVLDEAERHLQRAVELWLVAAGQGDRRTLAAQRQLAMTWRALDRLEDAERLNRHVLAISERVLGPSDDDTLTAANNLGYALLKMGRYEAAEEFLRRVYELRRQHLGPEHEHTLLSMRNLGQLYRLWGRHEEAGPLLEHVLASVRASLPSDHPEQLFSLQEWISYLLDMGLGDDAIEQYVMLCELSDRVRGPRHLETIRYWMNLAINYRNKQRFDDALATIRVAQDRSVDLPEDHELRCEQSTIEADAWSGIGRTEEALRTLDAVAARMKAHPAPTFQLRYSLAMARINVLRRAEDWPATLSECDKVLALCAEADAVGPRRGVAQIYRGRALRMLRRFDEADSALRAAEADVEGMAHMPALCREFIDLYAEMDRPHEVEQWERRLARTQPR